MTYLINRTIKLVVIICAMIFCANSYVYGGNNAKLHRIVNIERMGTSFIIHTERNDSLFKIISDMHLHLIDTKLYDYEPLVIGNYYNLNLYIIVPVSYFGFEDVSDCAYYRVRRDDMGIGRVIKIDSKIHNRIYASKNLNGLYYVKPKEHTTATPN